MAGSVCTDCLQAGPHVQAAARGSLGRFQLLFSDSFKGCFTLQKMASAGPLSNSHTILTVTNRGAECLSLEPETIKCLEERGAECHDVGFGDNFFGIIQKAQVTKVLPLSMAV